jgi:hypothetical protein
MRAGGRVLLGVAGPAEESSVELSSLGRREARFLEHLQDVIGELLLLGRKRRRVSPAQTSMNVRVEPGARVRRLVSEAVQLAHLLEQRLELGVVDRHY